MLLIVITLSMWRFIVNMNKEELVQAVAKKSGASQKVTAEVLAALLETVEATVAEGNKVTLVGFGTFEPRERQARTGRNPQSGAVIQIAAKKVPVFTAGKKFKDAVSPMAPAAPAAKKKAAKK